MFTRVYYYCKCVVVCHHPVSIVCPKLHLFVVIVERREKLVGNSGLPGQSHAPHWSLSGHPTVHLDLRCRGQSLSYRNQITIIKDKQRDDNWWTISYRKCRGANIPLVCRGKTLHSLHAIVIV